MGKEGDEERKAIRLAYLLFLVAVVFASVAGGVLTAMLGGPVSVRFFSAMLDLIARLGGLVLYLIAAFSLKNGLEAAPIDIPLSGVMTFFFSATYFQYHLYDYSVEGRVAEQLSGFGEPAAAVAPVVGEMPEVPPQA